MTHPLDLSVPALAAAIRAGTIAAHEAVGATLEAIDARDGTLNAVVARDADAALAQARIVDQQVADGDVDDLPPYAGVPTLIKDLNNASGLPTSFGARSMADFTAPFDDHAVAGIRGAGFVIVGKTNVPELGSLPYTEALLHGPARNPWNPDHTPGGSSGGAAAAVGAGYVPVAHGSDGGGSIRIPSSCCGVVGIKPSRGRISHAPLFGDQVMGFSTQGSIGRRVVDAAALLDVMHGYATGDPYHLPAPERSYVEEAGRDPGRLRVGVLESVPWAAPDEEVRSALASTIATLEGLGHTVEEAEVTLPRDVPERFLRIWSASVASNPLPVDQLEPHNRAFAEAGWDLSAPELLRDFTSLQLLARSVVGAFSAFDAVLAPVLMSPPLRVGQLAELPHDALVEAMAAHIGICPLINVTGQPATALPVHVGAEGLPVGVQLIGAPGDEAGLIRLSGQIERERGWARLGPSATRA